MKKRTIISLILTFALMCAMILSSCGGGKAKTIEDYINGSPEAQEQIQKAADESGTVVTYSGNDMVYSFDISGVEGMTEEIATSGSMADSLNSLLDSANDRYVELCSSLEEEANIEGVTITVNYMYGETVVVTRTFTSSGSGE
jgi:hypothetical protein